MKPLRHKEMLSALSTILVLLSLWQLACTWGEIPHYILPKPSVIGTTLFRDAKTLYVHIEATLELAIVGMLAGTAFGIMVALILHLIPFFRAAFTPLLILSQNIPIVALGPLLMIWFGFGLTPKIILLILVCFFPVALSVTIGLEQGELPLREYLRMIGASRWQRLYMLELPGALPYLFSGLKIAASYVISSALVAEWMGASKGIGYYLKLKFSAFDQPAVFAAIFCVALLSLLFYYVIVILEKKVIRWQVVSNDKH